MDTVLLVTGHDARGYALARLVQTYAPENDQDADMPGRPVFRPGLTDCEYAILPHLGHYKPGDRRLAKVPVLDSPPTMIESLQVGDIVVSTDCRGWPGPGTQPDIWLLERMAVVGNSTALFTIIELADNWFASQLHGSNGSNGSNGNNGNNGSNGSTRPVLESIAPSSPGRHPFWTGYNCANAEHVEFGAQAQVANTQPDLGLIMAWLDEENGQIQTHIAASTGAYLFWAESPNCEEASIDQPQEPGLWLFSEGQGWSSTDWESGIVDGWGMHGKLSTISVSDAAPKFGMDESALKASLLEGIQEYIDEGCAGAAELASRLGLATAAPLKL